MIFVKYVSLCFIFIYILYGISILQIQKLVANIDFVKILYSILGTHFCGDFVPYYRYWGGV